MFNHTKPEALPELDKIFTKHSGEHRVYLKIISPKNWETLLATDRHVLPSEEMLGEVRELLGKEALPEMHGLNKTGTLNDNLISTETSPAVDSLKPDMQN